MISRPIDWTQSADDLPAHARNAVVWVGRTPVITYIIARERSAALHSGVLVLKFLVGEHFGGVLRHDIDKGTMLEVRAIADAHWEGVVQQCIDPTKLAPTKLTCADDIDPCLLEWEELT